MTSLSIINVSFLISLFALGSIYLGGIMLSLIRWRHHPRASLLAIIGLSTLFLGMLLGFAVRVFVSSRITMSGSDVGMVFQFSGVVQTVLSAIGLSLVIMAVFTDRAIRQRFETDRFPERSAPSDRREAPRVVRGAPSEAFRDKPPT